MCEQSHDQRMSVTGVAVIKACMAFHSALDFIGGRHFMEGRGRRPGAVQDEDRTTMTTAVWLRKAAQLHSARPWKTRSRVSQHADLIPRKTCFHSSPHSVGLPWVFLFISSIDIQVFFSNYTPRTLLISHLRQIYSQAPQNLPYSIHNRMDAKWSWQQKSVFERRQVQTHRPHLSAEVVVQEIVTEQSYCNTYLHKEETLECHVVQIFSFFFFFVACFSAFFSSSSCSFLSKASRLIISTFWKSETFLTGHEFTNDVNRNISCLMSDTCAQITRSVYLLKSSFVQRHWSCFTLAHVTCMLFTGASTLILRSSFLQKYLGQGAFVAAGWTGVCLLGGTGDGAGWCCKPFHWGSLVGRASRGPFVWWRRTANCKVTWMQWTNVNSTSCQKTPTTSLGADLNRKNSPLRYSYTSRLAAHQPSHRTQST